MKWLLIVGLVACSTQPVRKLPGASPTPLIAPRVTRACGLDVSNESHPAYDARYLYTYDDLGRVAHATGHYASGGPDDQIDYAYDHLDHMTHYIESRGAAYGSSEQTETFDTLGDLVDYTIDQHAPGYSDSTRYTYADLTASGQPKSEIIVENGGPAARYLLTYDATDRLVTATLAGGSTTTYTYDDEDTRTLTIDTDNGAFHGVVVYDAQSRELSETWGGSDPQATARSTVYLYAGDLLQTVTYQEAGATETDTMRYACDTP